MRKRLVILGAALAVAASVVALSACGSSSGSGSSTSASSTGAAATAATSSYSGVEASVPHSFPTPTTKAGYTFTIGSAVPSMAVPALKAQADSAKAETERLGGKWIQTDANFSVQQQVSDVQQLLSQHVNAIVLSALDPNALTPLLAQAKKQGTLVYVNDVPFKVGIPLVPGISATALSGTDQSAYARAKYVADTEPGAKYGLVGIGIPAPMLDYMVSQVKVWGDKFGLQYVDRVDASTDSPEAGAQAAAALIAKDPSIKVIFAASDATAIGAATAARQAGRTDIKVIGNGGYAAGIDAVRSGQLAATYWTDSYRLHTQLVDAAYNALTGQNAGQPKEIVLNDGVLVTKANVNSVKPVG